MYYIFTKPSLLNNFAWRNISSKTLEMSAEVQVDISEKV